MCVNRAVLCGLLIVCLQFLCTGGRSLLEQQFRRFLSQKYPQYQLGGGGVAEVGGARKRKQAAPRKAYHQPSAGKAGEAGEGGDRWCTLQ